MYFIAGLFLSKASSRNLTEQVRFQSDDGAKGRRLNATPLVLWCIKEAPIVVGSLVSRFVSFLGQRLSRYGQGRSICCCA
jgi:hypothetical protein